MKLIWDWIYSKIDFIWKSTWASNLILIQLEIRDRTGRVVFRWKTFRKYQFGQILLILTCVHTKLILTLIIIVFASLSSPLYHSASSSSLLKQENKRAGWPRVWKQAANFWHLEEMRRKHCHDRHHHPHHYHHRHRHRHPHRHQRQGDHHGDHGWIVKKLDFASVIGNLYQWINCLFQYPEKKNQQNKIPAAKGKN